MLSRRKLIVPGDTQATLAFCVEHWIGIARGAIQKKGRFAAALSGGSTPKAIFEHLTLPQNAERLDWSKVFLFWSDERAVPPDHPESNFHMAMKAGFEKLPIPPSQIFRMEAEKEIEKSALLYEETIQAVLGTSPFDLVMLGMGEDGHTASLFPHTKGLKAANRLVIANFIPQKKCWRMTMTFKCINAAENCAVYVLGATKKEMLAKVMSCPENIEEIPSQGVGTIERPSLWIADSDAI